MDMTRFGTQAQKDADGNVGKFKECIETAIMRDVLTQVVRWCCGLHCIGLAQVVHGDDGEPAAPLSCGLQPRVSAADESGALPPGGYVASITPPTEEFSGGVELLPV
eukprot:gene6813-8139_t